MSEEWSEIGKDAKAVRVVRKEEPRRNNEIRFE